MLCFRVPDTQLMILLSILLNYCHSQEHLSLLQSLVRRGYDLYGINPDPKLHDVHFFKFVTRPDIDAPKWDITIYNKSALSSGYWFVAPYTVVEQLDHDEAYVGPYIYSGNGELVWSGASIFGGYAVFDFKVSKVDHREMLSAVWLHGNSSVIIDNNYQMCKTVKTGRDAESTNIHDFQTIDGTKALFLTRDRKLTSKVDSLAIEFPGHCYVQFTGFEERDLSSGEVLFRWSPEDRIGLEESMMKGPTGKECKSEPWDYLHANSIEKLPDGDYLLSGHRTYALYKISHKDGSIVWRLGGSMSDFKWIGDVQFGGQHDARCRSQNETHILISVMDNANGPGEPKITNTHSRGLLIALRTDSDPMTAQVVAHYDHPWMSYAPARGNFQILPNGNAFIGWSMSALHSEYTANNTLIMEAQLHPGLKTYRSYKFPWIGLPEVPPDVHSVMVQVRNETVTIVHVSWNGATEVASWILYRSDQTGASAQLVASSPKQGFETPLTYNGHADYVFVEAVDREGTVLGTSLVVSTITAPGKLHSAVLEQIRWLQEHPVTGTNSDTFLSYVVWKSKGSSTFSNPIVALLSGILFCLTVGMLLWASMHVWKTSPQDRRPKMPAYEALLMGDHA